MSAPEQHAARESAVLPKLIAIDTAACGWIEQFTGRSGATVRSLADAVQSMFDAWAETHHADNWAPMALVSKLDGVATLAPDEAVLAAVASAKLAIANYREPT